MKREIKLYNVIFPLWLILLLPQMWLIVLPGNFLIDSLVLIVSMYLLKIADKKTFYKRNIFKIFGFGIFSDVIGSVYMLLMVVVFHFGRSGDELYLSVPTIIISAISIFLLNYFITLRKYDNKTRLKLALIFAVVTAPYTFLIPTSWIYR